MTIDTSNIQGYFDLTDIEATDTQGATVDEVQTVTLSNATGGEFTLRFEGQTTSSLAYGELKER